MALQCILEGDMQSVDLSQPDGIKIIWPLPRDPKIDVHAVLSNMLEQNGLDFIGVVTEPTFMPSLLHDKNGKWTAVIAITRGSDRARRYGITERVAFMINDGSGNLVDITPSVLDAIPQGAPIDLFAQASESLVNIDIFSINTVLSEQLYLFVKTALFAAEKPYFFDALGYLDFIRVDGRDEVSGIDYQGGTHILAGRSLTYRTVTLEFLASASYQIVDLIKVAFTGQTVQPGPYLATVLENSTNTQVVVDTVDAITEGMAIFVGPQLTNVLAIFQTTITVGPMEYAAQAGQTVMGISTAMETTELPP